MAKTNSKIIARAKRVQRIRTKISGTATKPRLRVFRSNKHIYCQIIDDVQQRTLVSFSSGDNHDGLVGIKGKCELAKKVGQLLAEKAISSGITQVVFDRGGYLYHGRVRALSEGAREGGLLF